MRDIAFVDVETTGLAPESSVVEVAVFRTSHDRMFRFLEEEVREWKVMPPDDCHIEEKALEVNGFSRELWKGAPLFDVAQLEFTELLHNAIVAGWNVKFDLGMLEGEYRRMGTERMPWHYHSLDVMGFMMPLYFAGEVTSLSLHAACDYFGVSNKGEHGAKTDVLRTTHVFYHLCRRYGMFVDAGWENRTCIDCGADTTWLGHFAPSVAGKGFLCNSCKSKRDSEEIRGKLTSRFSGSEGDLRALLAEARVTVVHIDKSHVDEDSTVDVYVKEQDASVREVARAFVQEHFLVHVLVNIRWEGDMGRLGVYR